MSQTDEQYTILAVSEMLDTALDSLTRNFTKMEGDVDNKFLVTLDIAKIEGVARYLRAKKKVIVETQP